MLTKKGVREGKKEKNFSLLQKSIIRYKFYVLILVLVRLMMTYIRYKHGLL